MNELMRLVEKGSIVSSCQPCACKQAVVECSRLTGVYLSASVVRIPVYLPSNIGLSHATPIHQRYRLLQVHIYLFTDIPTEELFEDSISVWRRSLRDEGIEWVNVPDYIHQVHARSKQDAECLNFVEFDQFVTVLSCARLHSICVP